VGDDVVQLLRDPQPLLGDGPLALGGRPCAARPDVQAGEAADRAQEREPEQVAVGELRAAGDAVDRADDDHAARRRGGLLPRAGRPDRVERDQQRGRERAVDRREERGEGDQAERDERPAPPDQQRQRGEDAERRDEELVARVGCGDGAGSTSTITSSVSPMSCVRVDGLRSHFGRDTGGA
jgi:hypothetical protein